jgi:predicted nucleotidyltransferase component of viral defense system
MITLIQDRLKDYKARSKQEEIGALKEIYQEIALAGLARSDFFKIAAFQGGTALRIVHNLKRFSEDLDFILIKSDASFEWEQYLHAISLEFASFGVNLEVKNRSEATGAVKKAFLKEDSFAQILELTYERLRSDEKKIVIKLEIDTNPPQGSDFESVFLTYPYPFSVLVQDLPSLFAGKCHALLCRKYEKGRDWFDFLWYVSKEIPVNPRFLLNGLNQSGSFKNQKFDFNRNWFCEELAKKIHSINWNVVRTDVENFLRLEERIIVQNWNKDLFLQQIDKIVFLD